MSAINFAGILFSFKLAIMMFSRSGKNIIEREVENVLSVKFGKTVRILVSVSMGGGCINHASKIETTAGEFFLKWNSDCAPDLFLREAESLNELRKAAAGQLIVPDVFAAKQVDETPGFLVQEYLPPRSAKPGDDEKLGRGLALIHKYSNEYHGFYSNNYCGATLQNNSWGENWAVFYRDNRLRFLLDLIRLERPLPISEIAIYEKLLDKIPQLIPKNSTPVIVHGDLWSGNYMLTENGPALIDPASYFADREMEFSIITMFGGFSNRFFSAYNEVNPLPEGWGKRNKIYQLYHILNHYYLFGGGYRKQALQIAESYI
jgi:protein-ribulosamine 3-kinase